MDNNYTNNEFKVPEGYFDRSRERLMKSIQSEEFKVPENYFDSSKKAILTKVAMQAEEPTTRGRIVRMVFLVASAAAVLVLGIVLFKNDPQPATREPSFAELIQQTELDESLVFEEATTDEILEYFGHELILEESDTTVVRPQNTKKEKKQTDIKRKEIKTAPSIEEISEEDIIKYLMEEGGADEF